MATDNMKIVANNLLYRFETESFRNDGIYSRNVNLVLAFDEYVKALSDEDISDLLGGEENVAVFRHMISRGVDIWLDSSMVKTLCLR